MRRQEPPITAAPLIFDSPSPNLLGTVGQSIRRAGGSQSLLFACKLYLIDSLTTLRESSIHPTRQLHVLPLEWCML